MWRKPTKKSNKKCFLSTVNAWLTAGAWPTSCHYLTKLKGYKVKGRSRIGFGGVLKDLLSWKTGNSGTQQSKKKQQFFILSNGLSKHSSIVDAKPVPSFTQALYPVIQCDICTLCYVNVCRCVCVCRYLMHVYSLLSFFSGSVRANLVFAMGMRISLCALLLVNVRPTLWNVFVFCRPPFAFAMILKGPLPSFLRTVLTFEGGIALYVQHPVFLTTYGGHTLILSSIVFWQFTSDQPTIRSSAFVTPLYAKPPCRTDFRN